MADALIKDYSCLQKDLDSLKLKIWEEIVSCCILRKKLLKLDEQDHFETLRFLDDRFADICEDYFANLEKTRDFDRILYLNKTWKAERLIRRLKKILRDLKKLRCQLERRRNYLDLGG